MPGFTEKECVECERCGAYIPKIMVMYHQCKGSDLSKRPANIPLGRWIEQQRINDLNTQLINKYIRQLGEDEPTTPRVYMMNAPSKGQIYVYTAIGFLIGGIVAVVIFALAKVL